MKAEILYPLFGLLCFGLGAVTFVSYPFNLDFKVYTYTAQTLWVVMFFSVLIGSKE